MYHIFHKKKTKFLEQQISILEIFLKDHVTPKTGEIMQKIQLCISGINNIFYYIKIENSYLNVTILLLLLYFCLNKCSLGERTRYSSEQ